MLRAIAGYILGGILNDVPEENMECEAREVNDWLVVNMPDKPDENDFDLESETESVTDEDDILSCLSTLMSSEELQFINSFIDENKRITEIPRVSLDSQEISTYFPQKLHNSLKVDSFIDEKERIAEIPRASLDSQEITTYFPEKKLHNSLKVDSFTDEKERINEIPRASLESQEKTKYPPLIKLRNSLEDGSFFLEKIIPIATLAPEETRKCFCELGELREYTVEEAVLASLEHLKRPANSNKFSIFYNKTVANGSKLLPKDPRTPKVKGQEREKNSDLTCHYVQTPTYVNHRPPITAAKTDLLQQIKDLQPSQKAKEIAGRKLLSRSNLNRQNKNYIFCSSAKTNRRKDLQRNHSGANNNRNMNRKC